MATRNVNQTGCLEVAARYTNCISTSFRIQICEHTIPLQRPPQWLAPSPSYITSRDFVVVREENPCTRVSLSTYERMRMSMCSDLMQTGTQQCRRHAGRQGSPIKERAVCCTELQSPMVAYLHVLCSDAKSTCQAHLLVEFQTNRRAVNLETHDAATQRGRLADSDE